MGLGLGNQLELTPFHDSPHSPQSACSVILGAPAGQFEQPSTAITYKLVAATLLAIFPILFVVVAYGRLRHRIVRSDTAIVKYERKKSGKVVEARDLMRDGAHTLRSRASSFVGTTRPPNGRNGLIRNGSNGKKANGRAPGSRLLGFGARNSKVTPKGTPKVAPAKGGEGQESGGGQKAGPAIVSPLGRPMSLSKWKAAGNVVIATNRSAPAWELPKLCL